jgi:hypothetical protein
MKPKAESSLRLQRIGERRDGSSSNWLSFEKGDGRFGS